MIKKIFIVLSVFTVLASFLSCSSASSPSTPQATSTATPNVTPTANVTAPLAAIKMIFIHHSTGSDWIASGTGNLGTNLNLNNYAVTESDYGWVGNLNTACAGYAPIGDHTDTGNWPCWFTDETMADVYSNTRTYDYTVNTIATPTTPVEAVMFKSCYPNSEVGASIDDEKAVYNGLLTYFAAHLDKLFILVIPPPEIVIDSATLTRQLADWLADRNVGWLAGYGHNNVFAFDYYNVLTHPDNHHRIGADGREEHIIANSQNTLYYYSGSNDHPTAAGHQKATAEFLPLLNSWYHIWKGI